MKNLVTKLNEYIDQADLFEISDRRFLCLVELYRDVLKLNNTNLDDSAPSEDLKKFFEAIENSIK